MIPWEHDCKTCLYNTEPKARACWECDAKVNLMTGEITTQLEMVPVVRCKECKYRDPEDYKCDSGALERMGCIFPVADDYFCAWGKRREDGQTD